MEIVRLWNWLRQMLRDDQMARQNLRDAEQVLRKMLELAPKGYDIDTAMREALHRLDPVDGAYRVPRFAEFIRLHTRREDRTASWVRIVEHLLEDLPCIYGVSSDTSAIDR